MKTPPKPPTRSHRPRRSSFPPEEITKPRNEKVSDFFQLGQLYEELRPEFQRALKETAHSLLRLQNEVDQDPKVEFEKR